MPTPHTRTTSWASVHARHCQLRTDACNTAADTRAAEPSWTHPPCFLGRVRPIEVPRPRERHADRQSNGLLTAPHGTGGHRPPRPHTVQGAVRVHVGGIRRREPPCSRLLRPTKGKVPHTKTRAIGSSRGTTLGPSTALPQSTPHTQAQACKGSDSSTDAPMRPDTAYTHERTRPNTHTTSTHGHTHSCEGADPHL
jgi:hypothetical protein